MLLLTINVNLRNIYLHDNVRLFMVPIILFILPYHKEYTKHFNLLPLHVSEKVAFQNGAEHLYFLMQKTAF